MRRFLLSQLRHRRSRTMALGAGILVAAVSFTLLTSAADTSELRVTGVVSHNFRSAYDILVRPAGSITPLERERGLVRSNYLSGSFGGITLSQWRQIKQLPGVAVAAPIANIGYIIPAVIIRVPLSGLPAGSGQALYRLRLTWLANNGASRYPGATPYVYLTSMPGGCKVPGVHSPQPRSPFALEGPQNAYLQCTRAGSHVSAEIDALFPILVSAIDPVQENKLLDLDGTIVAGRGLGESDTFGTTHLGSDVPVIVSTKTFVDQSLRVDIERVQLPRGQSVADVLDRADNHRAIAELPGAVVARESMSSQDLYSRVLSQMQTETIPYISDYWTVSPPRYLALPNGSLEAQPVANDPLKAWSDPVGFGGFFQAPPGNQDVQFRDLTIHNVVLNNEHAGDAILTVLGWFDPEKLPGFSRLTAVPLESYYPPIARPADAATQRVLHGGSLLPTMNLGGYMQQPPFMLTTLRAAGGFFDKRFFHGTVGEAPISVIRVRVADVTGPDPVSTERIRTVAQAIHYRTGLSVDVTAGSSPRPLLIDLPAGKFGQPPLTVREGWVQKGVAVAFLDAIDRKSLVLFGLILVICGFFLANGTLASVRSRRTEIGTLLCLGWSERAIFRAVLGEVALVGLVAGVIGSGLAALLVPALSLQMPIARTLLALPVALVLALLSGLLPAWRAARSEPMDAVRPAISERRLHHHLRRVLGVAAANLSRVPSRTALGAAGLAIGVAALTVLLALNLAFHGVLVGTLLGNAISVQVRGVDLLAVAFTIALGGLSVLDVLFLNVRERAAELVTLRTVGWRESDLRLLIVAEGVGIGALGCLGGALLGATGASFVRGVPIASIALAAGVSAGAGVAVAALASLVPLGLIERLTPPTVLAEE